MSIYENEMSAAAKTCFAKNKPVVIEALKTSGIARISVEYSGAGDDGGNRDIYSFDEHGEISIPTGVYVDAFYLQYTDSTVLEDRVELGTLIDRLCDLAIEASGHSGYENGTGGGGGGGGEFIIDVAQGSFVLEHFDIIEERNESSHVL